MKEKLTNNWALKLISVCLAVFLWLIVINGTNPMEYKTVTVYNIEYRNENVVVDSNKTYTLEKNLESSGVAVTVPVRRQDYNKVRGSDFKVIVDLAKMGPFGSVDIVVEWLGSDEYEIRESDITWKTPNVTVILEDVMKAAHRIGIQTVGTPADEYIVGDDIQVTPRIVEIMAPQSVMEQIHSVGIEVNVDGMNSEVSGTAQLKLYDVAGKELNLDPASYEDYAFSISQSEISYTVPLLKTKEVGLRFDTPQGTVAEGYRYTGIQGANQTVHIAGLRGALADVEFIQIPSEVLNLDGATQNVEVQIDTSRYVPEGITVESENVVTVTLVVEPLIRQSRQLLPEDIRMESGQEGWNYTIRGSAEIVIEGLEEDLNALTDEMLDAWISLADMQEGVNTAELHVTLDNAFKLISAGNVTVTMEPVPVPETTQDITGESQGGGAGTGSAGSAETSSGSAASGAHGTTGVSQTSKPEEQSGGRAGGTDAS